MALQSFLARHFGAQHFLWFQSVGPPDTRSTSLFPRVRQDLCPENWMVLGLEFLGEIEFKSDTFIHEEPSDGSLLRVREDLRPENINVLGLESLGEMEFKSDVLLREEPAGGSLLRVREDLRTENESVLGLEFLGETPRVDTLIREKNYDHTPA